MSLKLFYQPQYLGLLSLALFGLAQFASIALYPAIAERLELPVSEVVLTFTVGSLLFIWSARFWSKKSDDLGRMKVLGYGLIGLSLSLMSLIVFPSVFSLAFGRLIYGLTASGIVSVVQAWWKDSDGDVTKKMFTHSIGLNIGRLCAPALVWILYGDLELILVSLALIIFIIGVISLLGPKVEATKSTQKIESNKYQNNAIVFLAFLSASFIGLIHSLLATRLQSRLFLSSSETSLLCSKILLLSGVAVILIQLFLRRMNNLNAYVLIGSGFFSWLIFAILFSRFSSSIESWFMILFFSIGLSTLMPGYLSLVSSGGKAAGAIVSVQSLGLCFGQGLGFLQLKEFMGLEVLFVALGVSMAVSIGKTLFLRSSYE